MTRHMINWAHMAIAMACLAVLLMVGTMVLGIVCVYLGILA